jgi:hypothetical protein
MAPMPTLRRAALVGLTTLLVATVARAQTASADVPPPPPAEPPPAPVQPLSPTMAPEPAPAPALQLTERSQPAPQQEAFYRRTWFWGVFAVAFATAFVITFVLLNDKAHDPPNTTFGNMHAF